MALVVFISAASAVAQPPQGSQRLPTPRPLEVVELMRIPGVAGYEQVSQALARRIPRWAEAATDGLGNLVATVGSGSPHTVLVAPIDERGYVISDITEDGYLRLYSGTAGDYPLFDQYHYGQPMMVQAASGASVPAVSSTVSTHIAGDRPGGDRSRIRGIDDLWIDLGADSRAEVEALGVRDLDPVGLRDRATVLADGRVAGLQAQGRASRATADTRPSRGFYDRWVASPRRNR
jgi:putative aminopeptidase FrvX